MSSETIMDTLPTEILCYINDFMNIIDQINFSQINKYNYKNVKINTDLPDLIVINNYIPDINDLRHVNRLSNISMIITFRSIKSSLQKMHRNVQNLIEKEVLRKRTKRVIGYVEAFTSIQFIVIIKDKYFSQNDCSVSVGINHNNSSIIDYYNNSNITGLIRHLYDIYSNIKQNPQLTSF